MKKSKGTSWTQIRSWFYNDAGVLPHLDSSSLRSNQSKSLPSFFCCTFCHHEKMIRWRNIHQQKEGRSASFMYKKSREQLKYYISLEKFSPNILDMKWDLYTFIDLKKERKSRTWCCIDFTIIVFWLLICDPMDSSPPDPSVFCCFLEIVHSCTNVRLGTTK